MFHQILDPMCVPRLFDQEDHRLEVAATMFNGRGVNQDFAIEIAHDPLGSILGTINTDDGKPFRTNSLNTRLNHPGWPAQYRLSKRLRTSFCTLFSDFNFCSYLLCLSKEKRCSNISHKSRGSKFFRFMVSRTTYQGISPIDYELSW